MGLFIGTAHAAEAADGGATGLPQLDLTTFPSQIFWLLVTLVVLYLLFSRVVLPRIGGVIEERHDAVEDDLDRAAEYKRQAQEAEKAWQHALAEARAEAQRISDATRAEIQAQVDEATAKADAEIAAKAVESEKRLAEIRGQAREAVAEVASEAAVAVVAAVAPGAADDEAVKAAVAARMSN